MYILIRYDMSGYLEREKKYLPKFKNLPVL